MRVADHLAAQVANGDSFPKGPKWLKIGVWPIFPFTNRVFNGFLMGFLPQNGIQTPKPSEGVCKLGLFWGVKPTPSQEVRTGPLGLWKKTKKNTPNRESKTSEGKKSWLKSES